MKKVFKLVFISILLVSLIGCNKPKRETAEVAFKRSFDEYILGAGNQWEQLRSQGIYVPDLGEQFAPLDNYIFELFTNIQYNISSTDQKDKNIFILNINVHFADLFPSYEAINSHLDQAESLQDLEVNQLIAIVNETKSSRSETIQVELTYDENEKAWDITGGTDSFTAVIIANLNGYFK